MHIKSKKPRAGWELPRFIRKESGAAYKQTAPHLLIYKANPCKHKAYTAL